MSKSDDETSVKADSDDSDASVKKEVSSKKTKKPTKKAAETKKGLLNIFTKKISFSFYFQKYSLKQIIQIKILTNQLLWMKKRLKQNQNQKKLPKSLFPIKLNLNQVN
jgi:hypothetical protein